MDQLESSTSGLIAQLKGKPTLKRYCAATIYDDCFSGLSFVFLQKSTTAGETLQSKHAFKSFAKGLGVNRIGHYHANNGRFTEILWLDDVQKQQQGQSYCGVNAHHQNPRAEKCICDLQDCAKFSHSHKGKVAAVDLSKRMSLCLAHCKQGTYVYSI